MNDEESWSWPSLPKTESEFVAMMLSLDAALAKVGAKPFQRPLRAMHRVATTFFMSEKIVIIDPEDRMPPRGAPFSPQDMMERVREWYSQMYAEDLFMPGRGYVVVEVLGSLRRLRLPVFYGTMAVFADRDLENRGASLGVRAPSQFNVLTAVEGLTAKAAQLMPIEDINEVLLRFRAGLSAMDALDQLRDSDLGANAHADYGHSVDALLKGEWGKARWESAQTAEKVMKRHLERAGHEFPKSGRDGHALSLLADLVRDKLGMRVPIQPVAALQCAASVRYDGSATREQALSAHLGLLALLAAFAKGQ